MLAFENDYSEGAHPRILQRLLETNLEQASGYGADPYCASAIEKIKAACECPQAQIRFLVGGTQTNQTVIDSMLQSYEGVIAADTGHVSLHEAGAIEFTGHKVIALAQKEGKLAAKTVKDYLIKFHGDDSKDHMVFPGMVYISHPTEYGTLYTKDELTALSEVCKEYDIPLYLDGARLGYGLVSPGTDVTLPDIARLCDVFYIGGTKVGALCGEAVVFTKNNMPKQFVTLVKQHGALLAKGRLLGIQFDTLFTDNMYTEISRNAIELAEMLRGILKEKGYKMYLETPTNQIFVVLENKVMQKLSEQVKISFWEALDENHSVVRFATSWATTKQSVEQLAVVLEVLKKEFPEQEETLYEEKMLRVGESEYRFVMPQQVTAERMQAELNRVMSNQMIMNIDEKDFEALFGKQKKIYVGMTECSDEEEMEQAAISALTMSKRAMGGKEPTGGLLMIAGDCGMSAIYAASTSVEKKLQGNFIFGFDYREDVNGDLPVEVMILLGE